MALAPNLAEIIADIGAAGKIVGLSSYGRVPPGAEKAERLGGFVDPSIERIIALQPDLVVGVPFQKRPLEACRNAGVRVLELDSSTIESTLEAYSSLGEILDFADDARRARETLERRLSGIESKASKLRPRKTLFLLGRAGDDLQQVFPVGPGNFEDQLLKIAGGQNVLTSAVPSLSVESVVTLAPEVIIEASMDAEGDRVEVELAPSPLWSRLPTVPAVREGQVYAISDSAVLVPGPRMAEGAALLHQLVHGAAREPLAAAP